MPTTYTNGLKLPDLGSIDWFNAYKNNIDILDPIVGTVNGVATTYAPISHNHDASEITSGTIDIARLPPAALERLTTVADQTARYALTTSTVQLGDTVKQLDTGIMYLVVDTTKLNSADGYVEYSAGTASKAIADEDGTSIKTGYVNVAGNQTVSGDKSWTGNNTFNGIKSTGVIRVEKSTGDTEFEIVNGEVDATVNTLSRQDDIRFYDKNIKITGGLRLTYTTDTGTKIELYARSWKADGTASYNRSLTIYTNGQTGEYYTTLETNFLPKTTSVYSLGSSSYQWSSVYAQTYYYNGTAWGLDKENVWTTDNKFRGSNLSLQNGLKEIGSSSSAGHYTIHFKDKNSADMGYITHQTTLLRFSLLNKFTNGAYDPNGTQVENSFSLYVNPDGTKSADILSNFIPGVTNLYNLGTSTNKWKTLNGVNPGALSLPDASNAVALDITNVSMDGTYTYLSVSVNGWLYLALKDTSIKTDGELTFYIGDSGTTSAYAKWAVNFVCSTDGYVRCFIPVLANSRIRVRVNPNGGSPTGLTMTIYPCLGNV